jgi:hypothetical protein
MAILNEAGFPFIKPETLNDPAIYPPSHDLQNSQITLPLSPEGGKALRRPLGAIHGG